MFILLFFLILGSLVLIGLAITRPIKRDLKKVLSTTDMPSDYYYVPPKKEKSSMLWKSLNKFNASFRPLEQIPIIKRLVQKLISAGIVPNIFLFFLIKTICLIAFPIVVWIIVKINYNLLILVAAIGFFIPDLWLKIRITKRHNAIARDLPNIIDLLDLCVGAGLDFMLVIGKVLREFKTCILTNELFEVYRQIQMGKSRAEALKRFAWRLDMPEVSSFVYTLIQADRLGAPISQTLRVLSEEVRLRRIQRGEAMAMKAPIKLLFPLLIFILPVVLVIVAGPILIQFSKGGIGF